MRGVPRLRRAISNAPSASASTFSSPAERDGAVELLATLIQQPRFPAAAVEREKARLARSAASAREIETKRARLADLDAEIARLDPPDTGDLAAFAGKVHPSITRQRNAHLTDTRVARLARVCVEAERLRAWLEAVS